MNGSQNRCHESVISIEDVHFSYGERKVLSGVNFSVLERDFVGLIGSNGAGKTTLLKMIVGLLKPDKGEIRLFGTPVSRFKDWERIGYVPQKSGFNPFFPATVKEIVLSGFYGRKKLLRRITRQEMKQCEDALHALGIEDLADVRIGHLSGGQQQRVFLARALVNNPQLLILDEPTVGIDAETQRGFFHLIRHMHQHHHLTFLMVSHDLELMKSYLGNEPKYQSGGLQFFVKHSHDMEDCSETDLTHSLTELRRSMETAVQPGR